MLLYSFIRLCSLGDGYSEEEIRAAIAGEREHQPKKDGKKRLFLQLLIDVQAKMDEGKGQAHKK